MEQSFVRFQPRPKADIRIGASVPAEFHERIQQYCEENHLPISTMVRFAVARFMREV